ncbi:MAG: hypothetical protein IKF64_07075, partial [Eubacterium sp.]|nr:hypothetical protein [Eubacterium sp.]
MNHDNETIVLSGFVPSIPTVNTYTATWKNYDGAVLKTDEEIEEGTTPTYFGKMPAKPSTDTHFYAFSGWTPAVEPIEEDTTYTATFTEMAKSSAVDGCETFVTKSFEDTREFVGEHIRAKNSKVTATDYGWSANNNFRTTVEGRNGEKIVKLVLTRASSYGAAPVVYVNDTAVSGTLSGDVYTFDNLNATYVHIGTGSNVWFDFTDLVAYYKKAEVSETISLAYAPLSTISGTHYTVSADNLVGESALTINDMHPMTINARKGETITKVVLTYRTGDDKDTLSASSGTFDGDATFSNINAQQVTISSWENVDISGVTVYFDGDINDPTMTLTGGANAKSSGGLSTQSYLPGAMDTVTYTALADATFPEFETYTLNGVTVERTSDTVVTVSGTPTENTAITVPDAESSSKIVTWNATLLNDYIADEISDGNGYSDTANGITLTTSEGEVDYFGNSYLETYDGTTLSFSTAAGKFTSIEIEANNIYDGGNWTKDGNILKWNGTPSESVSLTGDVFIMGLSSITFVIEPNTYTVTWENSDGTTLETDTDVAEGTTPTYDGATPTKATDEKYMYFFSGWSPEVTAVTGDITYTAQFDKQVIGLYLMEGDVVDKDETIRFPLVYRGNEFSGHVLKVYLDGELVKSVEVQGASSIEPDRYYTTTQKCIVSQFSKGSTWPTIYNTIYLTSLHTVTWQNADGTVLETDTDVAEGTVPTYDGTTPTKAEDAQYTYTFTGWSPEVTAATEDVTYTATYTATPKPAEPTTDVSFTKVTDASQITAENIGTCTADEAAAWIVANWDSIELVPNQATLFAFYSDGVLCGFATGDYITKAEFEEHPENFIVTDVPLSVFVDAFNAGKIYLCTPSAAPAEPNNETSITVADTINEKFYLDKDFYEEAYG